MHQEEKQFFCILCAEKKVEMSRETETELRLHFEKDHKEVKPVLGQSYEDRWKTEGGRKAADVEVMTILKRCFPDGQAK